MKTETKQKKSAAESKFVYHHLYYDLVFKVCLDFYAGDREEVAKLIFKKYKYETAKNCLGESVIMIDQKDHTERQLIWIGDLSNFYTLSHELIHFVKDVFSRDKIPFVVENDETIAYYHTFWFRKIWHDIGEFDKKFNEKNDKTKK